MAKRKRDTARRPDKPHRPRRAGGPREHANHAKHAKNLGEANPSDFESWLVASPDDPEHREARITRPFELLDHRDDADGAPSPTGAESARLWGLRLVDDRVYLTPLGVTYPTEAGPALVRALPAASLVSWLLPDPPPAVILGNPAVCPTMTHISGTDVYGTGGIYATTAAAKSAGRALAKKRSRTGAGLVLNSYQCPNPACTSKKLIGFKERHTLGTSTSLLGSIGWGGWRYYAWGTYWWSAIIRCS